jgi:arylsulfatase A-like enzyme
VVLITIDTLRADHLGPYGGPGATPALDRLAAEGVVVENAYTPMPSTGPAHASLLTGRYPWNHRTLKNAVPMDPTQATLADWLQRRGIATAAIVSSYILHPRFGFHQGFDTYRFEPTEEYLWRGKQRDRFWTRGEHTTRAANTWLTKHGSEPFFLWLHYFDPHTPYLPPPGFAVDPKDPIDLEGKRLRGTRKSADQLRRAILAYRGEVAYTDFQVGLVIERLRLLDLLDRTAVIVTADHGEGLGDHGVLEHGVNLFDELVRVPLLIRAPGIPAGARRDGVVQLEDIAPTILALYGAEPPEGVDGVDLLPWLRGETDVAPRESVFGRRRPYGNKPDRFFERRGDRKWIGNPLKNGAIFHLDGDPREREPQPGSGPSQALLDAIGQRVPAPNQPADDSPGDSSSDRVRERDVDPDPEVRRALQALGYLEE